MWNKFFLISKNIVHSGNLHVITVKQIEFKFVNFVNPKKILAMNEKKKFYFEFVNSVNPE